MGYIEKGSSSGSNEPSGFLPNDIHGTALSHGKIHKARTEGYQQARDDVHLVTRWVNTSLDVELDAEAMHMGFLNAVEHRYVQA